MLKEIEESISDYVRESGTNPERATRIAGLLSNICEKSISLGRQYAVDSLAIPTHGYFSRAAMETFSVKDPGSVSEVTDLLEEYFMDGWKAQMWPTNSAISGGAFMIDLQERYQALIRSYAEKHNCSPGTAMLKSGAEFETVGYRFYSMGRRDGECNKRLESYLLNAIALCHFPSLDDLAGDAAALMLECYESGWKDGGGK